MERSGIWQILLSLFNFLILKGDILLMSAVLKLNKILQMYLYDVCIERITFLGDNSSNSAQFKAMYVSYKNFISDDTVTVFMQSTVNCMFLIAAASVIRITQKLVTQHFILLVSCLLLIFWQSANTISNCSKSLSCTFVFPFY